MRAVGKIAWLTSKCGPQSKVTHTPGATSFGAHCAWPCRLCTEAGLNAGGAPCCGNGIAGGGAVAVGWEQAREARAKAASRAGATRMGSIYKTSDAFGRSVPGTVATKKCAKAAGNRRVRRPQRVIPRARLPLGTPDPMAA